MIGLNNNFCRTTLLLEHWIFPLIFILFAGQMILGLIDLFFFDGLHDFVYYSRWVRYLLLLLFNISVAYFLFMARNNTKIYPDKIREIVLPMAATFWFFTYSIVEGVPESINPVILPPLVYKWIFPAGVFFNLIGLGISIVGVFHLRQSFGITVKINDVITNGLYRVVRHPIYFGYLLTAAGFMMMTPRFFHLLTYVVSIILQILRARVEEDKLAQFSEEYRRYMKQVPFIIPAVFKARGQALKT